MVTRGTDFSKTALGLTNPMEVRNLLTAFDKARKHATACEVVLAETEPYKTLDKAMGALNKAREAVKEAIDRAGSYQDIEGGLYAIKQRRTSISYDPVMVRKNIADYAQGVIEETVATDKIKGLLRGKLITQAQAEACQMVTELNPAYIIDVLGEVTNAD